MPFDYMHNRYLCLGDMNGTKCMGVDSLVTDKCVNMYGWHMNKYTFMGDSWIRTDALVTDESMNDLWISTHARMTNGLVHMHGWQMNK